MEVIHDDFIPNGAETFEVDVTGLPNALCAVSQDGVLLGNGYTDGTGHAIIQFFSPIGATGEVRLVVTGFNAIPYSTILTVGPPNLPPAKPETPTGRTTGAPGNTYMYSSSTTDPESDGLYYLWDWGDGNFSEWLGPYASGNTVSTQKSWTELGNYSIRIKAKDSQGHESEWSDPLVVTMPHNLPYMVKLMDLLQNLFPRLYHFFEMVVGL
jgi:hypothetical protein